MRLIGGRNSNEGCPKNPQPNDLTAAAQRHGWRVVADFVDEGISGAKGRDERTAFDQLCRYQFDVIAAWSVAWGAPCRTSSAFSMRFMAQGFGVFGEFERAMIVERVRAAIAKALAQGNRSGKAIGHPEKVPAAKIAAVRAALVTGNGIRKVARAVGMEMERFSRSLGRCGRPEPSGGWGP